MKLHAPTRFYDGERWHDAGAAPTSTVHADAVEYRTEEKQPMFRRDVVDNAFVARQLEFVRAAALAPAEVPLKSRSLVPTDNSVPEGALTHTYRQWKMTGSAAFIADKADDLPTVETGSEEHSVRMHLIGDSYEYSHQELLNAQFAQVPLDQRMALAARRAIELKIEEVAKSGDAGHGLLGFFNQSGTAEYELPTDGTDSSALWSKKDSAKICRDLSGMADSVYYGTNETEVPDTIVLPVEAFKLIANTPYSEESPDTILTTFLRNSQMIRTIVPWSAAEYAGAEGVGRAVCYRRSNEVLVHLISEFQQLPIEVRGLKYVVPCIARSGGVVVFRPLAMSYSDGLTPAAE